MYKLKDILLGIIRHMRRNVISCLLLAAVLSFAFCGIFYIDYGNIAAADVNEKYGNRYYVAFRDELQYNGNRNNSETMIRFNGTTTSNGPTIFFDDDKMRGYDHPYPLTAEVFETLGEFESCEGYELAYAENAMSFTEGLPSGFQGELNKFFGIFETTPTPTSVVTQHTVVGGSLDAFTAMARENNNLDVLYDFVLNEGREAGAGECVITDFYAYLTGKSVGDMFTLCDVYGNVIAELEISGIYNVYEVDRYCDYATPSVPKSTRWLTGLSLDDDFSGIPAIGTPYDRVSEDPDTLAYIKENYSDSYRILSAMLSVIHTDLETAYNLYGTPETDDDFAERHHFNNFYAYYNLQDGADTAAFSEEMRSLFPTEFADEFTVYSFERSRSEYVRFPETVAEDGVMLTMLGMSIAVFVFFIVSLVQMQENMKETGIYLGLGIRERDVSIKIAAENTIMAAFSTVIGAFCGRYMHRLFSEGWVYLEATEAQYYVPLWSVHAAVGVLAAAVSLVCSASLCLLAPRGNLHHSRPVKPAVFGLYRTNATSAQHDCRGK